MTGEPLNFNDFEDFDNQVYKNYKDYIVKDIIPLNLYNNIRTAEKKGDNEEFKIEDLIYNGQ